MIPKKNSPESLSSLLDDFLDQPFLADYIREKNLKDNWGSVVGQRIAELAEIVEFKPPALKIRVESASWKMELSYKKAEIMEQVNVHLGAKIIEELVII